MGAVDYGGCDYSRFYGECDYGGCEYGEFEYSGFFFIKQNYQEFTVRSYLQNKTNN